jgi:hypothetical protein
MTLSRLMNVEIQDAQWHELMLSARVIKQEQLLLPNLQQPHNRVCGEVAKHVELVVPLPQLLCICDDGMKGLRFRRGATHRIQDLCHTIFDNSAKLNK